MAAESASRPRPLCVVSCALSTSAEPFPAKIVAAQRSQARVVGIETMVRLKPGQRRLLVAHIPPLANLAAGSLLFGQFLSERPYSLMVALIGFGTWFALFGIAFFFAAGSDV
jgi:hypothetical protein